METPPQNQSSQEQPSKKPFLLGILIFAIAFAATFATTERIGRRTLYPEYIPQARCNSRLKGLGTALEIYAQAESQFPNSLDALVEEGYASEKNFICPAACEEGNISTAFPSDYVLIIHSIHSQQTDDYPGSLLIMFELPINHDQEHVNLLFKAGHVVEERDMGEYRRLIQEVNDFLVTKGGTRP